MAVTSNPYFQALSGQGDTPQTGQTCPLGSKWMQSQSQCMTRGQIDAALAAYLLRGDQAGWQALHDDDAKSGVISPLGQGVTLANFLGLSGLTLGVVLVGVLLVLIAVYAWLSEKNIKIAGFELPKV